MNAFTSRMILQLERHRPRRRVRRPRKPVEPPTRAPGFARLSQGAGFAMPPVLR